MPGGRISTNMSEHKATISWKRASSNFLSGKYSREHAWRFDGGVIVPASPSPSVVPVPYSNPAHVDPEEAFVAAVSSCHMLTYLYLACQRFAFSGEPVMIPASFAYFVSSKAGAI